MFDLLQKHIASRIQITNEEFSTLTSFFKLKKIRKRQYLLQEGETAKYIAFVNSGCLRVYTVDHKAIEHIIHFAIKDWWVADLNSYLSGLPGQYNIDALQDSEVLLLEKSARDKMLEVVPKLERFFRLLMEANYIATHKRIVESLSSSAEERYLNFIKVYPELFEQVPQHHIASYLGITPQSLSRIRKEIAQPGKRK